MGELHPILYETVRKLVNEFDKISPERKSILREFAKFIKNKAEANQRIELVFICTHNSRRSHISQIWAQTAAAYYGVSNVKSYSGGTETTAFNPRAVKAMERVGFEIEQDGNIDNPIYRVSFNFDRDPVVAYSKRYDDHSNPKGNFAAILTCSHADENCPVIFGMERRFALPYDDPKDFDGTTVESEKYLQRAMEIGRELLFAFSLVKRW